MFSQKEREERETERERERSENISDVNLMEFSVKQVGRKRKNMWDLRSNLLSVRERISRKL